METRDPTKTEIFNNAPEPECLSKQQNCIVTFF